MCSRISIKNLLNSIDDITPTSSTENVSSQHLQTTEMNQMIDPLSISLGHSKHHFRANSHDFSVNSPSSHHSPYRPVLPSTPPHELFFSENRARAKSLPPIFSHHPTPPSHTYEQQDTPDPRDDKIHNCPLQYCNSRFNRKFNMIQHFKSHAARLGIDPVRIEDAVQQIKLSRKGDKPFVFI
jgi:hypothetical protein